MSIFSDLRAIARSIAALVTSQQTALQLLHEVWQETRKTNAQLEKLTKILSEDEVVGIDVSHSKESKMAAKSKFKVAFAPKGMQAGKLAKATAQAPAVDFSLQEGDGDTVTVNGVTGAGTVVDISALATLAVASDNMAILITETPEGMTYKEKAKTAGDAVVTVVATWNDNSIGPFSFSYPVKVTTGGVTGLVITHGPVTPN